MIEPLDVLTFINELKKALLDLAKRSGIETLPLDVQTSIIELHRKLQWYLDQYES